MRKNIKKLLVLSALLILAANPTLAAGLRIDEFEPESGCGFFLRKPQQKGVVFDTSYSPEYTKTKMKINGKLIYFSVYFKDVDNKKTKNIYNYISHDGSIKVTIKIIKLGKLIANEWQEIDKAVLTVMKGKQKVQINVKGGNGC
jgi:hypothetical protein